MKKSLRRKKLAVSTYSKEKSNEFTGENLL